MAVYNRAAEVIRLKPFEDDMLVLYAIVLPVAFEYTVFYIARALLTSLWSALVLTLPVLNDLLFTEIGAL